MSIFQTLLHNSRSKALTHHPDDRVEPPNRYRGQVVQDASLCVGCTTCAYVCSPSAITFEDQVGDHVAWQYDAGRCTFCGRCVAFCPTHALSSVPQPTPLATTRDEQLTVHHIQYQACADCGKPIIPLPLAALDTFSLPLQTAIAERVHLCEACRKRAASETVKRSFLGEKTHDR
ncbi:MAG TPA: 4Fe-4S binding protein [Aggregatilinea sp.]|uniref:4Fe-4S dicluster domain-containing protein n=1 Tax=Aggregatilinea sp. TaxID=2806333 RepID=UPI002CD1B10B|nr:4Fe-4S dicluster domain-containing protein [Aggregatilinea sp.]HML22457.1 4Fe-4S binding protein [Aggregatilinea sp.]